MEEKTVPVFTPFSLMAVKAWDELPSRNGYQVNKQNGR